MFLFVHVKTHYALRLQSLEAIASAFHIVV
jgi:hypothetical protein